MASTPREQLLDFKFVAATFIGIMGMYTIALAIGWFTTRNLKVATLKGFVNGYRTQRSWASPSSRRCTAPAFIRCSC
jgi:hypothetical protein